MKPAWNFQIEAQNGAVTAITFRKRSSSGKNAVEKMVQRSLKNYVDGRAKEFSFPINPQGTAFQQDVWKALRKIPYGKTATYGEIAARIGRPRAVRAVANAIAKNPLTIVIPCHRVVPAHGKSVGGFAWGTARKQWLLRHERRER